MSKKQKKMLIRIIVALVVFIACEITEKLIHLSGVWDTVVKAAMFAVPYLMAGYDVLLKAIKNISKGHVFDENFLMAVATVGAYGTGEFGEAAAVMLFYQVGEWFQKYAVNRSRASITDLMNIMPEYANIEKDGQIVQVEPETVAIGDIIIVQPGEKVPLDGTVIEGETFVDTAALTGESVPRKLSVGDEVLSGVINQNGVIRVKVSKEFDDSTVSKILELVENASTRKAQYEQFITRFAKYYTPIVCFLALAVAIIPPIFVGEFGKWFHRALIFLVVSCPCALVISIPLSFFSGIGGASKAGILVKGSNYLELLGKAKIAVFDKTGTLTKGVFKVVETCTNGISEDDLLELAAYGEYYSNHPIAASIKAAYKGTVQIDHLDGYEEISGMGIKVLKDGKEVLVGNKKLLDSRKISMAGAKQPSKVGTVLFVAENAAVLVAPAETDIGVLDVEELFPHLLADRRVQRTEHAHIMSLCREGLGQRACHVAQTAGLDERSAFAGYIHDFHKCRASPQAEAWGPSVPVLISKCAGTAFTARRTAYIFIILVSCVLQYRDFSRTFLLPEPFFRLSPVHFTENVQIVEFLAIVMG